jgi:hypothetical protein
MHSSTVDCRFKDSSGDRLLAQNKYSYPETTSNQLLAQLRKLPKHLKYSSTVGSLSTSFKNGIGWVGGKRNKNLVNGENQMEVSS